ncbi:MAG: hypothetical protein RBQ91_00405 [Acholeplasma sp.]|nr:hypothetical protein [Acholeplasma sp.]
MAKKRVLKKSTKKSIWKVVFLVVVVAALMLAIVPFTTLSATAPSWWKEIHNFFTDVRTNILDYASFLAIVLGLIFGSYFVYNKVLK